MMSWRAPLAWSGRNDGAGEEHARWHSVIRPWAADQAAGTVLLGLASDEGVKRNQGRPGAVEGPQALRKALSSMALQRLLPLYDDGDVVVDGGDLEAAQIEYGARLAACLRAGHFTIGLGGGHEIAWASYLGVRAALGERGQWKLGVLNLDPHLDMRAADHSTSGTGFYQIACAEQQAGREFRYAVLGVSDASNTRVLFERARQWNVRMLSDDDCRLDRLPAMLDFVGQFARGVDHLYLTIDLDVLPAAVAPGVSAPAALGVAPEVVQAVVEEVAASGKLFHADFAELSPPFDIDGRTARTAARLIHRLATCRRSAS